MPRRDYRKKMAADTAESREQSRKGRDIAPCPPVANRRRRNACAASLRKFLETYFKATFPLPWSEDHLETIARLEEVVTTGGQYAVAAPRGDGKTSRTERAALWAVLTGRRRFVVIVGANETLAEHALGRIKGELMHNDLLLADWPRTAYPIRELEGQARRCVGQHLGGARTEIVWQRKRLILPTMPGPNNEASGAVLHATGLQAGLRGLSHVTPDGETIRPDLLLVDDPQDRDSARSVVQTAERVAILNGDLLGLAGPGRRISALATVTVIQRNDLADQLLDTDRNPQWRGSRYELVKRWPDRTDLWDEYLILRAEGFRPGGDRGEGATAFYREHRAEMDAGAVVSWPARREPAELSAIQHAYNLRQDLGDVAFEAEYQNRPRQQTVEAEVLDPVAIAGRCGGFERGVAPPNCEKISAFIDVGSTVLWWLVAGWCEDFSAQVLDYGAWPEQTSRVFLARNASPALEDVYPGNEDARVYAGLADIAGHLFGRTWRRSDGAELPLSRVLIDSGWSRDVVRLFVRQSPYRERLTPSKGIGIGPGQTAIADFHKRDGEKIGDGWILGAAGPDRLRLLRFDANHWKTRLAGMLTRPMGERGGVTLWGDRPVEHELLALHLSSETATPTTAKGVTVSMWARKADRENHLLDCLTGAAVAASLEGLSPLAQLGGNLPVRPKRRYVSISELKQQARLRREARE
jgi:hypothetical protein